jgi:type II secretory pathway component PulF
MLRPGSHEQLAKSLRHAADAYRRQTQAQADWLTRYLPLLLTVVIGGTATGIYVLCVFVPWLQFLVDMGRPL